MIQEKVSFKNTRIPLCMVRWTLGDSYIASGPPQGRGLGHHPVCFRCSPLTPLIYSMDMSFSKLRETVQDRGPCWAAVCGVTKSQTRLSD